MAGVITAHTRQEPRHQVDGVIAANLQPVAAMAALQVIIPVLRMMTAVTGATITEAAVAISPLL